MQIVVRYKTCNTTGHSEAADYLLVFGTINAHAMFAIDFSERTKLGHKLISHAGDEKEISAAWEIP
jgi:hypothetical protein